MNKHLVWGNLKYQLDLVNDMKRMLEAKLFIVDSWYESDTAEDKFVQELADSMTAVTIAFRKVEIVS